MGTSYTQVQTKWLQSADDILKYIFLNQNAWILTRNEVCSHGSICQSALVQVVLMPNSWQAITWNNVDQNP